MYIRLKGFSIDENQNKKNNLENDLLLNSDHIISVEKYTGNLLELKVKTVISMVNGEKYQISQGSFDIDSLEKKLLKES